MWSEFMPLEVRCEFAAFSRMHQAAIEEAIDRALASGRDLARMILPWSHRPDHARRAHAVYALGWYHEHKKPKTRQCACGAIYEVPIRRGHVPRKCPDCNGADPPAARR